MACVIVCIRDIYYSDVALFETQAKTDKVIENLACMLNVPRNSLNVVASHKGLVFGNVTFQEKDVFYDCSTFLEGKTIPPFPDLITGKVTLETQRLTFLDIKTDARFLLIIEKEATFLRCNDQTYWLQS